MKRKYLIGMLALFILGSIALSGIWSLANEDIQDISKLESKKEYSCKEILELAEMADQNQEIIGEIIVVVGNLSNLNKDGDIPILELSEEGDLSSVVVQIDKRHANAIAQLKVGNQVSVKGRLVGLSADEMGLGNTADIKNAYLIKE